MKLFEEAQELLEAKNHWDIADLLFKLAQDRTGGAPAAYIQQLELILAGVQSIVKQRIDKLSREL